jgi:hypothetical protein
LQLLAWGETVRAQIEGIDGMLHADMYRSAPAEGMIVAAYEYEASYDAAADTVVEVLGGMAQFMTSPPHTHAGTVDVAYGR